MRFLYVERTSGKAQSTALTLSSIQHNAHAIGRSIIQGYIL
jgi:hypothetical protein